MAVEEAGQLDLRQSLTLFQVAETPPVKLALSLTRLFVHLRHDALDQLQLNRTTKSMPCEYVCPSSSNLDLKTVNWMELMSLLCVVMLLQATDITGLLITELSAS